MEWRALLVHQQTGDLSNLAGDVDLLVSLPRIGSLSPAYR